MTNYEKELIEHFQELMKMFKRHGVNNVCTDYPTMIDFLRNKHGIRWEDQNPLYWQLTHKIVPTLEKKKILMRYKLFDGTWVFVINKRLKIFRAPK